MAECPTCGRDDFKSRRGMKQHHAKAHNEALGVDTVTLTCENCGEQYEKRPHNAERSSYCSKSCKHEGHGGWGEDEEESECENCGEKFTHHPSRDRKYCSQKCHLNYLHEDLSGEESPLTNKVTLTCDECGKQFKRQKSRAELNDSDYCSYDCYHQNNSGEDAPYWKGGSINYYGESWHSQRRKAIDRDDEQCVDCGMTRDKHYDEYDKDLAVHHKTPIRTFEDTKRANKLSNLVTVCTNCHQKREHS